MSARHRAVAALLLHAAVGLVSFAVGLRCLWLTHTAGGMAVLWPASGVLVGLLLRGGVGQRAAAFGTAALGALGALAINPSNGNHLGLAAALVALELGKAAMSLMLLDRLGRPFALDSVRQLLILLAVGVAVPAVGTAAAMALLDYALHAQAAETWLAWWSGDAVGCLLFLPLAATLDIGALARFLRGARDRASLVILAECGAVSAALLAVAWLAIASGFGAPALFTPVLLWVALQRGATPTLAAAAVVCLGLSLGAAANLWPWSPATAATPAATVARLQLLVALVAVPALAVAVVVAERERLRLTLANAKRVLDDALASMTDGFALFDADDRLVMVNAALRHLFPRSGDLRVPGITAVELIGAAAARGEYKGVDPGNVDAWAAERIGAHRADSRQELELANGRWIEAVSRRVGAGGRVVAYRDITARKQTEHELAEAKRRLETIISAAPDGIVAIDGHGTVRSFNPAAERIFGFAFEEVVGRDVALLMPEPHASRHGDHLVRFRATGGAPSVIGATRPVEGRRKDGSTFPLELSVARVAGSEDGLLVGVLRDVTEGRRLQRELERMATRDPLTGLPNRAAFQSELRRAHARADRDRGRLAVMLVDLDRFKAVNDTHGHAVGDQLLVEAARRLEGAVREGDLVARLGGDEFAILAFGEGGDRTFAPLAHRVVEQLTGPVRLEGIELPLGGTLGLTVYPDDPGAPERLLVDADRALYAAKEVGRGGWATYRSGVGAGRGGGVSLEEGVASALGHSKLAVNHQPAVALGHAGVVGGDGAEAQRHTERRRLPAGAFTAGAERSQVIVPMIHGARSAPPASCSPPPGASQHDSDPVVAVAAVCAREPKSSAISPSSSGRGRAA